jgi:hypothetical protein
MGNAIQDEVRKMRMETFAATPQLTLGELIDQLRAIDITDDCEIEFAFGHMVPTMCDSWRGSYNELAIGYAHYNDVKTPPKAIDFIQHLEATVGTVFEGWKGGEYEMTQSTPVWAANPGEAPQTGVIGLHVLYNLNDKAWHIYIRTDYCEF